LELVQDFLPEAKIYVFLSVFAFLKVRSRNCVTEKSRRKSPGQAIEETGAKLSIFADF